jgi:acetyltransferase
MSIRNLEALLRPKSVVLIGASNRAGSLGAIIWKNLHAAGFAGPIYGVNLRKNALGDTPTFAHLNDLPEVPDLAIICTPAETVAVVLAELGVKGVKVAIVITAGLTAIQKTAMLQAAKPHLLRILGPNCLGAMTPEIGLNASFSQTFPSHGGLALISQSGALVTAILDWSKHRRIGFSHLISLGDCADVDFGDLIDLLGSDSNTRAIILYAESIQSARKFMSAARATARNKPVIVLKAGRSQQGGLAAASHSGGLAGSDIVIDAAIRRAGMLRVDTLQDVFTAVMALTRRGSKKSDSLTVLTNGGGAGVIAADYAAQLGVRLQNLDSEMIASLNKVLPSNWSKSNPIDIIGDAPVERYTNALTSLLHGNHGGTTLLIHAPTAMVSSKNIAQACINVLSESKDQVMSCWLGDETVSEARALFQREGIADYATPEEAIKAFAMLQTYHQNQALLMQAPLACEPTAASNPAIARKVVLAALSQGRAWLSMMEVDQLLSAYNIPTPKIYSIAATAQEAVRVAKEVGYPVALKIDSQLVQHKSDVGGVIVGLRNDHELIAACQQMKERLGKAMPNLRIERFIVQAMVDKSGMLELIVGSKIDSVFGPIIVFGHGGTAVEIIGDRAIGIPPINSILAEELISRTQIAKQMVGYRNFAPVNRAAISEVLVSLSSLLADIPEIVELDINPLCADSNGVIALDARVLLSPNGPGGLKNFAILPYPADLVEHLTWQGESITLRPIRPGDESQHRQFLEKLSPEDVRMRVFYARRELPTSELARLTQIDYAREMAFVAERTRPDGVNETLATVRASTNSEGYSAEFAIVVRTDLKRKGLGRIMMSKLIRYARAKGLSRLVGTILRENHAMRELAHELGFVSDVAHESQSDVVNVILTLQSNRAL